ncbi:MAG: hypothetical protein F6K24_28095 [Okeania sp. SIO2D1]|nr:hypothetical protein [Okeania sp. SIO2D1]
MEIINQNLGVDNRKKDSIKASKTVEKTGFDTVTQAQNYLKFINKKLKLWAEILIAIHVSFCATL